MPDCRILQDRGEDIIHIDVTIPLLADDKFSGNQGTIPFPSLQVPDAILLNQRMTRTHTRDNAGSSNAFRLVVYSVDSMEVGATASYLEDERSVRQQDELNELSVTSTSLVA